MSYRIYRTTAVVALTLGLLLALLTMVSPSPAKAACDPSRATLSAKLVPSCGTLFGAMAGAWTKSAGASSFKTLEAKTGGPLELFHYYYSGDRKFPGRKEIAVARQPGKNRVLLLNWKVARGMTWRDVARGKADKRIDAEAAYLRKNFREPFFLLIHHEPDNKVRARPGSGFEAKDFAAMYRRTISRLRAGGATNVVSVWATVGFSKWTTKSWFDDLYPGDAYVDWVGWDPYAVSGSAKSIWPGPEFKDLMDNTDNKRYPNGRPYEGMYKHITKRYPGKPIILPEIGLLERLPAGSKSRSRKARFFNSIRQQLPQYPAIKALAWFETPNDKEGFPGYNTRVDETRSNLAAWRALANSLNHVSFKAGKIRYAPGTYSPRASRKRVPPAPRPVQPPAANGRAFHVASTGMNGRTRGLRIPSSAKPGDTLLAFVTRNNLSKWTGAPTGVGGWTREFSGPQAGFQTVIYSHKVRPGESGKTIKVPTAPHTTIDVRLSVYRGLNASNPIAGVKTSQEKKKSKITTPVGKWSGGPVLQGWFVKSPRVRGLSVTSRVELHSKGIGTGSGRLTTSIGWQRKVIGGVAGGHEARFNGVGRSLVGLTVALRSARK